MKEVFYTRAKNKRVTLTAYRDVTFLTSIHRFRVLLPVCDVSWP